MELTLNGRTALAITRMLRADARSSGPFSRKTGLVPPDPSPLKRWGKSCFEQGRHELLGRFSGRPIDIAVPAEEMRVRTRGVTSTIYRRGIPDNAFIDLGNGVAISGPELLFAEMAKYMNPVEHLMLGHELCGSFSRDADDPFNGPVAYRRPPLTSARRLRAFLDEAKNVRGINAARRTLRYLNDNAWSPTESLVAALLRLPMDDLGYGIGELTLNPRVDPTRRLPGARGSRVPDIVIDGTPLGLNYDGLAHLDLRSIARAGVETGLHPELQQAEQALERAIADVRAKAIDDIRRNRELAAKGMMVFPLLKEDLYAPGGLDAMVNTLLDILESDYGRDVARQRRAAMSPTLCKERHRLMLSLLPGKAERGIQVARFIEGTKVSDALHSVLDYWIEF